jgi:NAD(P)-dependent dehydrogenase (short-subunit alcohol dehydrogenase family)
MIEVKPDRSPMLSLRGKTVLITGANGAIGQACAEKFRLLGAHLALTDLEKFSSTKINSGDCFVQADVRDKKSVACAYETMVNKGCVIDVAVLAAGIEGQVHLIENISVDDLDQVLAVNVRGPLLWMQHCLRDMKAARKGSIVLISSISGVVGSALLGSYTISKHAVIGLMRTAALEAGPTGVRVNAICPGPVKSPMMKRIHKALQSCNESRFSSQKDASQSLPLHRYVTADEVAAMAAFLGSQESSSCHGGVYMIDGGFTAK